METFSAINGTLIGLSQPVSNINFERGLYGNERLTAKGLSLDRSDTQVLLGAPALILLQIVGLRLFDQPWISQSGNFELWSDDIYSFENSQQLTDWYTFSHVLHGFFFYYGTGLFPLDVQTRFLIALGTEVLWEVAENSPIIVQRYRETALGQGYRGDSIVNSVMDTMAMSVGFALAHFLPYPVIIVLSLIEELYIGWKIRDNLLLNIIQIIRPNKNISKWQKNSLRVLPRQRRKKRTSRGRKH